MADDHNQRINRANEAPARGAPAANDPLAELARLIGQNDPFSEFGQGDRRAAQQQAAPSLDWPPATTPQRQQRPEAPQRPEPPLRAAEPPRYGSPDFSRQTYGGAPIVAGPNVYEVEHQVPGRDAPGYGSPGHEVPGYGAPGGYQASGFPAGADGAGYEHDPFQPQDDDADDYYDDAPPSRRRFGILAIAGVFALAVIGTAGAFGYRAVFGSTSVSGPPPVIKADTTPSKIVPAASAKDAQATKLITDRANERGQGERLVSREEQPLPVSPERPVQNVAPSAAPQLGSGIVGAEPKKIRTISIRPDGTTEVTSAMPSPTDNQPAAQPRVVNVTPARQPQAAAPAPAQSAPQAEPEPEPARHATSAPRQNEPRAETRAEAPAAANAPLSLNPNQPAAAPARSAPQRTAAVPQPARIAPAAASGGTGGYAVQVSARKSEEDAQAAFRSLQARYPSQLGGRAPMIKRVDLGAKGVFFRAMVGPFGSSSEASTLCSSLKSAGASCIVQKN